MHHVSAELCARFVADAPPDGCIDDAVRAWKKSDGDIREVVRAIVHSPDFWAPVNVQSKVKTPLEFVVSALRAVHGVPDSTPAHRPARRRSSASRSSSTQRPTATASARRTGSTAAPCWRG